LADVDDICLAAGLIVRLSGCIGCDFAQVRLVILLGLEGVGPSGQGNGDRGADDVFADLAIVSLILVLDKSLARNAGLVGWIIERLVGND
jgi:hypothetical protein